jgi:hypothetical protein
MKFLASVLTTTLQPAANAASAYIAKRARIAVSHSL